MSLNKRLMSSQPAPFVASENFNTVLYTGNSASDNSGTTQSITGVGFKPDWVIIKRRDGTENHYVHDSTRGSTKQIYTNLNNAEYNESNSVTSFDTDGFTVGGYNGTNNNGETYVAWCWKSNGGTTSSNSDGSQTTTVQANTNTGISIITGTMGSSGSSTFGHGLGVAPKMIIHRDRANANAWMVYHESMGAGKEVRLNESNAATSSTTPWGNTSPTTTVYTGGNGYIANAGANFVAYCFAEIDGFSKFGGYTGNGSANGPIVETGFEPAFLMVKGNSNSGSWLIFDNKRNTTNPRTKILYADSNTAETTNSNIRVDFLSNGFQLTGTDSDYNGDGRTYIYMAFAADPDTEAPTLASSFNIETYVGNGASNRAFTGLGFKPNFVWLKNRSAGSRDHMLFDSLRVSSTIHGLYANIANAEFTATANDFNSFDDDGFTVGKDPYTNASGQNIVAWCWKADDNEPTIFGGGARAMYKFEDNANDVSAEYNGTASNVSYVTGYFNKAAEFNGSSSGINIGNVGIGGSAERSISAWVNVDNLSSTQTIFQYGSNSNGQRFGFAIDTAGKIYVEFYNRDAITSSAHISANTWYHLVATYNGGAIEGVSNTQIYVNGVAVAMSNSGAQTGSANTGNSNYGIGYDRLNTRQYFDGKIDQVRIYKGVVSDEGVALLYAETAGQNDDLNLGGPPEYLISANANAGFSIVEYESNGFNPVFIPHGLSATPNMILIKCTSDGSTNWIVYHSSLGQNKYLTLNDNSAEDTSGNWLIPNALTMQFNNTFGNVNTNGRKYIAYCFHDVAGYQKFGSYAGSGSPVTVTTGFKPDFVMIKTTSSENWNVFDTRRGGDKRLYPDLSNAETDESSDYVTTTATSFTMTQTGNDALNTTGRNFIYWAIAKNVPSNTTLANSFKTVTYTGNGGTKSITGFGFKPDFIWIKKRDGTINHSLQDTLRGLRSQVSSNITAAATTYSSNIESYDTDGFTLGTATDTNNNNSTYVAWGWKAGQTWQSNRAGSIPTLVNANTANGFSIIKYDMNIDSATAFTIGHGLSSAPELVIFFSLDQSGSTSNLVYPNSPTKDIALDNDGTGSNSSNYWSNTAPSTTVINMGTAWGQYNSYYGGDTVAYAFHSVSGYSKIGSYTGTAGSFTVTTGFQPDFVMIKRTDTGSAGNWVIIDSSRASGGTRLYANLNNAEDTGQGETFSSTGFSPRGSSTADTNISGGTYLYMAIKAN